MSGNYFPLSLYFIKQKYQKRWFMSEIIEELTASADNTYGEISEVEKLTFNQQQSQLLSRLINDLAENIGPQDVGARYIAAKIATSLKITLDARQVQLIKLYSEGKISALIFDGLNKFSENVPENKLPPLADIECSKDARKMGLRSQVLLKLVDNLAFAYDIDNNGNIIRVVANYKGGGDSPLEMEPETPELSSHSGLALGPHTEAPYWCAVKSKNGHSPAPCSLILSALWNPQDEPTSIIPLPNILSSLTVNQCLALTSKWFQFTRSDSFVQGMGEDGRNVSIIDHDDNYGFTIKFNAYRFSVMSDAPELVKDAYNEFCKAIDQAKPIQHVLSQESVLMINNVRALHCLDIVKDNRRALIRLFGYSKYAEPIVYSEDPLLVRG